ncbi:MAG: hypothetical protein ACMVO3_00500 [Thalassobaculum sp.]
MATLRVVKISGAGFAWAIELLVVGDHPGVVRQRRGDDGGGDDGHGD